MTSSVDRRRRLLVQWRDDVDPAIYPVGVLTRDTRFRFAYLPGAGEVPGFRPLPPFPNLHKEYTSAELFGFFAARVMDKRRPEYLAFLHALGLDAGADVLTVLGRSGGRRKGDFISVVEEPTVDDDGSTAHTFLVHGVRHVHDPLARDSALARLSAGEHLHVQDEPDNPVNPQALLVTTAAGVALGWVPDGLLGYVRQLRGDDPRMTVVRVNGPDQPDQLRLLVEASGTLTPGAAPLPQLLAHA